MLLPEVMDYYRRGSERDRLASGTGRLEYLRTWDILARVLPAPPAAVVDVGGATGVYAGPLWLTGPRLAEILDDPALTALLLDMLRRVEDEPSLRGASSHLLVIGGH